LLILRPIPYMSVVFGDVEAMCSRQCCDGDCPVIKRQRPYLISNAAVICSTIPLNA
jgi:hypothetical protein